MPFASSLVCSGNFIIWVHHPSSEDKEFVEWQLNDYLVMTMLLNSMESYVSSNIIFLETAKEMWEALHQMYSDDKNVSHIYTLYEKSLP